MRLTWSGKAVIDDRGVRRRLVEVSTRAGIDRSFRLVGVLRERIDRADHDQRLRYARQFRHDLARLNLSLHPSMVAFTWAVGAVVAISCLGLGVFVVAQAFGQVRSTTVFVMGLLLVGLGVGSIAACVVAGRFVGWQVGRVRRHLDRLPEVCLACGFDLTGVPKAGEDLFVCPECGGAWMRLSLDRSGADGLA